MKLHKHIPSFRVSGLKNPITRKKVYGWHCLFAFVDEDADPFTVEQEQWEAQLDWVVLVFALSAAALASWWFLIALLVYPLCMWPAMPKPWSYLRAWVEINGHGHQYAAELESIGDYFRYAEMMFMVHKIARRSVFMKEYYSLPYTAEEIEARIWAVVERETGVKG